MKHPGSTPATPNDTTTPSTHSTGSGSREGGTPTIAIVPPPTSEEQLAKANAEIARLQSAHEANVEKNKELLEQVRKLTWNPFNLTMANIDEGAVLEEAGDQIKTLAAAVGRLQEKGTFTLKVTIEPHSNALVITGASKISEPRPKPVKSIFYTDEEGTLSRRDPRQRELDFSRGDRSHEGSDDEAYADERRRPELR